MEQPAIQWDEKISFSQLVLTITKANNHNKQKARGWLTFQDLFLI